MASPTGRLEDLPLAAAWRDSGPRGPGRGVGRRVARDAFPRACSGRSTVGAAGRDTRGCPRRYRHPGHHDHARRSHSARHRPLDSGGLVTAPHRVARLPGTVIPALHGTPDGPRSGRRPGRAPSPVRIPIWSGRAGQVAPAPQRTAGGSAVGIADAPGQGGKAGGASVSAYRRRIPDSTGSARRSGRSRSLLRKVKVVAGVPKSTSRVPNVSAKAR